MGHMPGAVRRKKGGGGNYLNPATAPLSHCIDFLDFSCLSDISLLFSQYQDLISYSVNLIWSIDQTVIMAPPKIAIVFVSYLSFHRNGHIPLPMNATRITQPSHD